MFNSDVVLRTKTISDRDDGKINLYLKFFIVTFCLYTNTYEYFSVKFSLPTIIGYFDELALALLFILSVWKTFSFNKKWMNFSLLAMILMFFLSVSIGTLNLNEFRFTENVIQSFINFKLLMMFFVVRYIYSYERSFLIRIAFFILTVSLVGVIFNIFKPSEFIYSTYTYALERERIIGFQFKPNDLALLVSYFSVYILYGNFKISSFIKIVLIFSIISILLMTTSRTALFIFLVFYFFSLVRYRSYKTMFFIFIFSIIFIMLKIDEVSNSFFITETVSNISEFNSMDSSQYIRGIMIYLGGKIMFDYFPFGFGAGSFGTVISDGSPVYNILGVSGMSFFQTMEGVFDSNLASILGEYGFIGIILFSYLSYNISSYFSNNDRTLKFCILSVIVISSLSQPFFSYHVNSLNFLLPLFLLKTRISSESFNDRA